MANLNSTEIGPNLENFLKAALPSDTLPSDSKSVLAAGEEHDDLYNVRFLADNAPLLTKQYNVRTAAFEHPFEMNVIYWAMRDGKLPLGADRQAYAEIVDLVTESDPARAPFSAPFIAKLQNHVIDSGGQLLAYDARDAGLAQFVDNLDDDPLPALFTHFMPKSTDALPQLRAGKMTFKDWSQYAIAEFNSEANKHSNFPPELRSLLTSNLGSLWVGNEINTILRANPEYISRLEKMKDYRNALLFVGKKEDDVSAHIVSRFSATEGNILTHSGYGHLNGERNDKAFGQGLFAAHLQRLGMKVTPVIFTGVKGINQDGSYEYEVKGCASKAPLNIAVGDMDVVLGADNDSLQRAANEAADSDAKKVARHLLRQEIKLTCDDPTLPTSAQCAQLEAVGKGSCLPR